ncbi:PAS domain S-box protein [Desulforhopalus sp. IMCC35007]|uniref:PAS domain S-box protein n=1 Tax=Desulforhopalus sp. IMCC35007 TaxID=2569543 RepID=UPI0010AE8C44|nr:PAS domain S-box protein [Desulforhopalus sp. IMCC35007]TKB09664.1 PAS domain S-box protein [Desulforhopalus sp. IMCC35007]
MLSPINKKPEICKIVATYFLFGCAWIFFSDSILGFLVKDTNTLTTLSTYKGIVFIFLTSALLYLLLARFNRKINQALDENRRSNEKLQFLVKNSSDILVILDKNGRQQYVSPVVERITGFTRAELEGKTLDTIIHPSDQNRVKDAFQNAVKHPDNTFTVQYRHLHKSKKWVHCEAVAQSFLHESSVNGVIANVRDNTEAMKAIEALAEKDALLGAMLRNLPFDFWARGNDLRVIMQSEESIKLWGDLISDPSIDWKFDPSTMAAWQRNNELALKGETVSGECELINCAGEQRVFHTIVVPILDGKEKLGILGINIDITDRKLAEQALRESEERFYHAFQYAPIGMALALPEGKYVKVNRALCSLTGYSRKELLSKTFQDITHPEHLTDDLANVQKMIRGEISFYQIEKCYIHKDGHVIWVLLSVSSIFNEDRTVKYFVSHVVDISSRKQREDELRKGDYLMKKIFDMLPIAVWFLDKDGNVRHQNNMGLEILASEPGLPFLGPRKIKVWRLPSLEPIEDENRASVKAFRKGITTVDELLEIETRDGKRKTVLNYATPIYDEERKIDGAIVVNLDISDRKKLEEQLILAQKMESVGRLAGGVAHDFNNMLSVILGNVELAMNLLSSDDPVLKRLRVVSDAAKRSAALTQQLLAFARRQPVSPQLLDLNGTVEEMLKMVRHLIGEDIELIWSPARNLPSIHIDPSQLDQLLVNLCVNARDAIRGTGTISVDTQHAVITRTTSTAYSKIPPGKYAVLTVRDNGCGMSKEIMSHLFEPFYTTKGQGRGTGLGLAMVYGIVTQNNGFIDVISEPGKETIFMIYLPSFTIPSDESGDREEQVDLCHGNETILLVEDEPMLIDLTKDMLVELGYTVLTAISPIEAIRLNKEYLGKIDLLITDVIMPEMNGRDLARAITSCCPGVKVLFISGYTADVIAHHGVLARSVHFLQKPITSKALAAKVREVLESEATFKL